MEIEGISNMNLNVHSIYVSLDGEVNGFNGPGELTTFIRLRGCNLACKYCDTKYARDGSLKTRLSVDEIVEQVKTEKVTITGGEPLLQNNCSDLITILIAKEKRVTVETNGTLPIPIIYTLDRMKVVERLRFVMDYKLPSSGMESKMNLEAFAKLNEWDIIKFVMADEEDFERAKQIIQKHSDWRAKKVFSPVFPLVGGICTNSWPVILAKKLISEQLPVQYSLQLHKVLEVL